MFQTFGLFIQEGALQPIPGGKRRAKKVINQNYDSKTVRLKAVFVSLERGPKFSIEIIFPEIENLSIIVLDSS